MINGANPEQRTRFVTPILPGQIYAKVRAISNEDKRIMLEERSMDIIIAQPFWLTIWAVLLYAAFLCLIAIILLRVLILRKQRKVSDEKIHFFINTAHDIRTPLTLIKAPLEELREKEELSKEGISNMNTALRNVNAYYVLPPILSTLKERTYILPNYIFQSMS